MRVRSVSERGASVTSGRIHRLRRLVRVLVILVFVLVGCGDDDDAADLSGGAAGAQGAEGGGGGEGGDETDPGVGGVEGDAGNAGAAADNSAGMAGASGGDADGLCAAVTCAPADPCRAEGVCDSGSGLCSYDALPDGEECDDGDACTAVDRCQSGECTGKEPVTCEAANPCQLAGTCAPATGECEYPTISVCEDLPPDPRLTAPPLDNTTPANVFAGTKFLYEGENPVQKGVAPGAIEAARSAALRGRVTTRDGAPLPGVVIAVHDHPELGQTRSRLDGRFDLVVNGGGVVTLEYHREDFLAAHRRLDLGWQEFVEIEDVALVRADPVVTTILLAAMTEPIAARSSLTADERGERQTTVLFPPGTTATMEMPDGTLQPLEELHVRLTEYTVGSNGPNSMPSGLPVTSAYTFAFEATVEEAVAAGARSVHFDPPVPGYVENFLELPTGIAVPFGYYDRERAVWVPSPDGRVIRVVAIEEGLAAVALAADEEPASEEELAAEGFTDGERRRLATLYAPGASLWRVRMPHFSPCDWNFSWGAPLSAIWPRNPRTPENQWRCSLEKRSGSIIECPGQVLQESLPLTGTPFNLTYRSDWVPGYVAARTLRIQLTDAKPLPSVLERVDLVVDVAGRKSTRSFTPEPNLVGEITWDGLDAYGRTTEGHPPATVRIGYVYPPVIGTTSIGIGSTNASFGGVATGVMSDVSGPWEATLWQTYDLDGPAVGRLSVRDARNQGLGGWMLDVHHVYDPVGKVLLLGDGQRVDASSLHATITTVAGGGTGLLEGKPATDVSLSSPSGVIPTPEGGFYLTDFHFIRHVDPRGVITTVAGGLDADNIGDGIPALGAYLVSPSHVALDADGNLYVSDSGSHRIRKISADGLIATVAGTGVAGFNGDDRPAIEAQLSSPAGIAFAGDGALYIADTSNHRIRRLGTNGVLTTVLGTGITNWDSVSAEEGVRATEASVFYPSHVALDDRGNVYFTDLHYPYQGYDDRVRKIDPTGIVTTIAGCLCDWRGPLLHGGLGTQTRLDAASAIVPAPDGSIYVAGWIHSMAIQRISPDGRIWPVAGGHGFAQYLGGRCGDGGLAQSSNTCFAPITAMARQADGSLLLVDQLYYDGQRQAVNNRIRRIATPLPSFSTSEYVVASPDGTEMFAFDGNGRHLRTVHALTSATTYAFSYDVRGRLSEVRDGDGNIARIEREDATNTVSIIAPYGQRTEMTLGTDGYAATVTSPNGATAEMVYRDEGRLQAFTDLRGQLHEYLFDDQGRLVHATDPAGGTQSMTRELVFDDMDESKLLGYRVTRTTAENHSTTYTDLGSQGDSLHRTVTAPDATDTLRSTGADRSTYSKRPNGVEVWVAPAPHDRFGVQSMYPGTTTVRLPSSTTSVTTVQQTSSVDASKNLISETLVTNVNGRSFQSVFTAQPREWRHRSAAGRESVVAVDAQGRPTEVRIAGLHALRMLRDASGRLTAVAQGSDAAERGLRYAYDASGFLASVTDGTSATTTFQRNADGYPTSQTLPGNRAVSLGFDAHGNMTSVAPPGQPEHALAYTPIDLLSTYTPPVTDEVPEPATDYAYDRDRQPTAITRPDGLVITFGYDGQGRLASLVLPQGSDLPLETVGYSYDEVSGQLASIRHSAGVDTAYTYDGFLVTGERLDGVRSTPVNLTRTFDVNFALASESIDGASAVTFARDPDGLLTRAGELTLTRSLENGLLTGTTLGRVIDSHDYSAFADETSYVARVDSSEVFRVDVPTDALDPGRDRAGRILRRVETIGGETTTWRYTYDAAGRLRDVTRNGEFWSHYEYDANGNRVLASVTWPGARTVSALHDEQDRLLASGDTGFTYTANGELRTKTENGQTTTYSYDVLGNLRSVDLPGGSLIEYLVDGRGRRVGKKVNGGLVHAFVYGTQLAPVAELDGSGNIVARFVYGSKVNVPEYMVRAGVTYRIVTDHLGSPRLVVHAGTGAIAQRMDFDEWGNVVADTNPGLQPFGFAGGIYDLDTRLVRFGARDYEARLGRWTAKEPALEILDRSSAYQYALNDPLNTFDPDGALPIPVLIVVASGLLYAGWDLWWNPVAPFCDTSPAARKARAQQALRGFAIGATTSAFALTMGPSAVGKRVAGAISGGSMGLVGNIAHQSTSGHAFSPAHAIAAIASGALAGAAFPDSTLGAAAKGFLAEQALSSVLDRIVGMSPATASAIVLELAGAR